jgi:hypothetical protein
MNKSISPQKAQRRTQKAQKFFGVDSLLAPHLTVVGAMPGQRENTEQTEMTEQTEFLQGFSVCSVISVCSVFSYSLHNPHTTVKCGATDSLL